MVHISHFTDNPHNSSIFGSEELSLARHSNHSAVTNPWEDQDVKGSSKAFGLGGSLHQSTAKTKTKNLIAKDKVTIVTPTTSMSHNVTTKLEQFCTEKLLQNKRRLTTLYGRQREIRLLETELNQICSKTTTGTKKINGKDHETNSHHRSLCLIRGLSGEGKTALALSLKDPAKHRGAFFVQGKFDLAQIGEPYSGIKAAMRQLCREISQLPPRKLSDPSKRPTLDDLQEAVAEQLDWEMDLLCQVVPELEVLLKPAAAETTKSPGPLQRLFSVRDCMSQRVISAMSTRKVTHFQSKHSLRRVNSHDSDDKSKAIEKTASLKNPFRSSIASPHPISTESTVTTVTTTTTTSRQRTRKQDRRKQQPGQKTAGTGIQRQLVVDETATVNTSTTTEEAPLRCQKTTDKKAGFRRQKTAEAGLQRRPTVETTTINNYNAKSAGDRLQFAMRKLIRLISGFVPLVLLCDDAQFSDTASLSILKGWITDDTIPSLLMIWTYRSNMVDDNHFVTKTLQEIQSVQDEKKIAIHDFAIGELHQGDVNAMIADLLDIPPEQVKELTAIIHQRTRGNVFFVMQYLLSLTQKGLLKYNMGCCQWNWNLQDIQFGSTATDNVVDLMREKLEQSCTARKLLPLAACIGTTFDAQVLQAVITAADDYPIFLDVLGSVFALEQSDFGGDIDNQLHQLESEGFIEASSATTFSFLHDKVLEGSISLIPEAELDNLKYTMGYILLENQERLEAQGVEQLTFLLVNLINPQLERLPAEKQIALYELNCAAAEEAYVAAAFRRSAVYYKAAISLLPERHWETMYEESLYLYTTAAESEMCLGNYDQMKSYSNVVLALDCPIQDKIHVYRIIMDAHMANAEVQEALKECLSVLGSLKFHLPKTLLGPRTLAAVANIKLHKKKWTPDSLRRLPVSKDPMDEAISKLHDSLIIFSMMTWPEAWPLCIIMACRHVIDRGLTRYSAVPFAWMTMIIQNVFMDFQWAKEHAEVTCSLMDKFQNREIESRISLVLNICTAHWTAPIQLSGKALTIGYKRGMECCDLDSAFWNAHFINESALYSGTNLALVEKDVESYTKNEMDYKMFKHADCLKSVWQLVLNLRGRSSNTTILTGTAHDEEAALNMLETSNDLHHLSHLQKDRLFAAAFFGDFELAANLGLSTIDMICKVLIGQYSTLVSRFILGVACYEMARQRPKRKKEYIGAAKKQRKQIRKWFSMGCPGAHHYVLFLDAENAASKGKLEDAIEFYQRTITLAGRTGYLHDRSLACERLAALYLRMDDVVSAKHRLIEARDLSEEWGAMKRVELLDEKLKSLF
ncbi:Transcriptional regulator [Seminavis robusta]|uniref:Transcriptional regulator n=1 Tax=Seminavis robusta TaxID=568900 RepID=A0A9N8F060_9STRA|nr:Transcriptional regulator [Seminavis robusta]|eukprot:Sro2402_g326340.1 Transcriptional regulator (1309) ;mRNA; f:3634-7637